MILCWFLPYINMNQPGASLVAQMESICLQCRRPTFSLWVGKILWRREWQPTPVFLLGELDGQRSLEGLHSPWGCKELDTTERLNIFTFVYTCILSLLNLPPTSHLPPHPTPLSCHRAAVWASRIIQQIPNGYLFLHMVQCLYFKNDFLGEMKCS